MIHEHRGALEYDFRSRFHLSLKDFGRQVEWGEAIRLVQLLRPDPSSRLAAAVEGWRYPLSREGWMFADLLDIQGGKAMGKKWKSYPRPIAEKTKKHVGKTDGRSRAEVLALLGKPPE